jgi:hypothetical protein
VSDLVIYATTPRGETVEIRDAPPEILVADEFLAEIGCHPSFSFGDGILTVHAVSGDVTYGPHHHDPYRRIWHATRSGA